MTTKPVLVIVLIVAVIATFVVSILYFSGKLPIRKPRQISQISQPTTVKVPEPNESSPEAGVAVPNASREIAPGSSSKIRTFDILANADEFSVKKIIVYEGDVVKINLNHRDVPGKEYDIYFPTLGVKQTFKSGQISSLEFQAPSPGEFEFYCQICLAEQDLALPDKNNEKTKGILLVVPK